MCIPSEQELWLEGMTSEEWLKKHDSEIRADERRKFAEWMYNQDYLTHIIYDRVEEYDGSMVYYESVERFSVDEILAEYEKGHKC